MKTLILFTLLPLLAHAQATGSRTLRQGQATYTVNYLTKTVVGTSKEVKGRIKCESACEFLLAIPLKSFDSGDSNRDLNMLGVVGAMEHPVTTAKGTFPSGTLETVSEISALVSLNGVEAPYKIKISDRGQKASFTLDLERHRIERPSLFAIKIQREVPVVFELDWVADGEN